MNTGSTTPNIGIYIPAAGEDGYSEDFASGMVNVDQHDHSGGPNKGLPIATEGLGAFSVTFDKLNANVVDPTTGVGTSGVFLNQIVMLNPLKAIFQLAPATGFITMDGSLAHVRTFVDTASVKWTNGNGVAGNVTANVDIAGLTPVVVANGGTGRTSFSANALVAGGATPTGVLQQVSGLGTANQVLTSSGAGLPTWQDLPTPAAQNLLMAQVTLTASQFRNLSGTPIQIVPHAGSGTIIIPYNAWGKLIYGGSDRFHDGSTVTFYYGSGLSTNVDMNFTIDDFKDMFSGYYSAIPFQSLSSTGIALSAIEDRSIYVSVASGDFTGGSGNSVVISVQYSVLTL